MASVHKEIVVNAPPDFVWDAVRDVGNAHVRLFPGVLVDARLEGEARVVTFANGMVLRELIVDVDDTARRFVYASVGGNTKQHSASIQVMPDGENRSRLIWISDFLPHDLRTVIAPLVEQGSEALRVTLERGAMQRA